MSQQHLRERLHRSIDLWLAPLGKGLAAAGIHPNRVTVLGASVAAIAAALVVGDRLAAAGVVWLFAGGLDLLDGALARAAQRTSALGAFLDSTLDRVSEGVMLAAVTYHLASHGHPAMAALVVVALLGSFLVSYTRARAEAIGLTCTVGLFTRAERVVVIGLGLIAGWPAVATVLLAIGTGVTAFQRVRHVGRCLTRQRRHSGVGPGAAERLQ